MENKRLYNFDRFTLDPSEKTLSSNGELIAITPKVFALLKLLVERNGKIVEKDEIMATVWSDSFVEESNLTYTIRQIRKLLGDDFSQPVFVETVPRRGYRFIAEVRESSATSVETMMENIPVADQSSPRFKYAIAICSIAVILIVGVFYYARSSSEPAASRDSRLAVLPFVNLKPDQESDHLGYAFADVLITKLTSMRTFKVLPTSMVDQFKRPQDVVNSATSDFVVTGTYFKENGKIIISSQLFDVSKNETLFQDNFEISEAQLSSTTEIITRRLINELRLRPNEISAHADMSAINPQAYNYFLKGIEQYSRFRIEDSIENLKKAVEIEPTFADAWDRLGNSYLVQASTKFGGKEFYDKAERAFRRSIILDPENTSPQHHLADLLIETDQKEKAIEILLPILAKDPENPNAWWELSYAYRYAGKLERSIEAGEKAHEVDLGFHLNASVPSYYIYVGNYEKFKSAVSRRTDSSYIKFYQGYAEFYLKDREAARTLFDEAYQLDSNSMQTQVGRALSLVISGENDKALELLLKTEKEVIDRDVSDGEGIYKVAQGFAILGDQTKALSLVELAVDKGFYCFPYLQTDPLIANLRNNSRYISILEKAKTKHDNFQY